MAAPKGNNYNTKYKTSKDRKKLCIKYVNHVLQGYSNESFPECDPQTLKRYMKLYPNDFDTVKIKQARRARRLFWEQLGMNGMLGKIQGFNAPTWIFNMKNRFEWRDKKDLTSRGEKIDPGTIIDTTGLVPKK